MLRPQDTVPVANEYPLWYCIDPKHWKELNDYCAQMESYCNELKSENEALKEEIDIIIQEEANRPRRKYKCSSEKRKRRTVRELEMEFPCPYARCRKEYASELALNLHIRNKHNGGSKTERENLAVFFILFQRLIALAEDKG